MDLIKLLIRELQNPLNTFASKDFLASKLEWAHTLQDAYLEDEEKKEVNRIFKKYKLPHRIQ